MATEIEGFVNVSQVLQGGVYMLLRHGQVIYVGQSKRMLNRVSAHLSVWASKRKEKIPEWLPIRGIYFDEVLIRPVHPDRIDAEEARLIDLYKPRYNVALKRPGHSTAPFQLTIAGKTIPFRSPTPSEPLVRRA